jgi:hypothetical protein
MSTRASVVIKYEDRVTRQPKEQWLYHPRDGSVRGMGEEIVRIVHDSQYYVDGFPGLNFLLRAFSQEFEEAASMHIDANFLYRITYTDKRVTVTARFRGHAAGDAEQHYSWTKDAPDNCVELYSAAFEGDIVMHVASFGYEIKEPASYIDLLSPDMQPYVRAWWGTLL